MKKLFLMLSVSLMLLTGCTQTSEPIMYDTTVGVLLPMSTADAAEATAMHRGISIAVDEYNKAHPYHKVSFVIEDTAGTVEGAFQAYENIGIHYAAKAYIASNKTVLDALGPVIQFEQTPLIAIYNDGEVAQEAVPAFFPLTITEPGTPEKKFAEKYKEQYKEDAPYAAAVGYDAFLLIAESFNPEKNTPAAIKAKLDSGLKLRGASGKIRMGENGYEIR